MQILAQTLPAGARSERYGNASDAVAPGAIVVLVGAGRGCSLHLPTAPAAIWLPLHGRLQLVGADGTQTLRTGELAVTEAGQRVQARGSGTALWLTVVAGQAAWERLFAGFIEHPRGEAVLLAGTHRADTALRRAAVRLARTARRAPADACDAALAFAAAIGELQAELDPLVARCPGRTLAQRRAVYARLQRAHQYLRSNCHHDLDIEHIARLANYSSWHFIRAYHDVYGRTPHVAIVAYRLERARDLLVRSQLAVAEVALASGFENRCAFSRLFKRHYGVTAIALRQSAQLAA